MRNRPIAILALLIFLSACRLPSEAASPTPDSAVLSTMVAKTLQALTPLATPSPLATPTSPEPATATFTAIPTFTPSPTLTATPETSVTPTLTSTPTITSTPKPGSIEGGIYGYPYGSIPSLSIVAFKVGTPYYWYFITAPGSTYYSMDDYVSPGKYQVVGYDSSGHRGGCTTIITVVSEQTVSCDITDWSFAYPTKPPSVP